MNPRRLWALTVLSKIDDDTVTEAIRTQPAPRTCDGCRSCGHDRRAHFAVGYDGWREQCADCACTDFRRPWSYVVLDLAAGVGLFALVFLLLALVVALS